MGASSLPKQPAVWRAPLGQALFPRLSLHQGAAKGWFREGPPYPNGHQTPIRTSTFPFGAKHHYLPRSRSVLTQQQVLGNIRTAIRIRGSLLPRLPDSGFLLAPLSEPHHGTMKIARLCFLPPVLGIELRVWHTLGKCHHRIIRLSGLSLLLKQDLTKWPQAGSC